LPKNDTLGTNFDLPLFCDQNVLNIWVLTWRERFVDRSRINAVSTHVQRNYA